MTSSVIDGVLVDAESARIPVADDGLLRGDGVFEVVRLYDGRPWALDEHLDRLALSARNLRLVLPLVEVERDVELLLAEASSANACVRIIVTRGGRRISRLEPVERSPSSIALATVEYLPPAYMQGVKSLSYAANMLAACLAREGGADDALFVTPEGQVLEATRASFFYAINDVLYTPPLDDLPIASITRRHIMAAVDVAERCTDRDDLADVTEAFIASTTKEVLGVRAIDGRDLPAGPGPMTSIAQAALSHRIRATLGLA